MIEGTDSFSDGERTLTPRGATPEARLLSALFGELAEVPEGGQIYDLETPLTVEKRVAEMDKLLVESGIDKDAITEDERDLLYLRFGATTGTPMFAQEIAERTGKTFEEVRQAEAKALSKLRPPTSPSV